MAKGCAISSIGVVLLPPQCFSWQRKEEKLFPHYTECFLWFWSNGCLDSLSRMLIGYHGVNAIVIVINKIIVFTTFRALLIFAQVNFKLICLNVSSTVSFQNPPKVNSCRHAEAKMFVHFWQICCPSIFGWLKLKYR